MYNDGEFVLIFQTLDKLNVDDKNIPVIKRVLTKAVHVFNSEKIAYAWLHETNYAMNGLTPLQLLEAEDGIKRTDAILSRIEYGEFS